ncbi:Uncaracterized surface protein containing fasciclin (FAS1) repeats [Mucilaginibacter pineti]|uniref:Uncaracterized surface protein containing fasciclin (FAS1) repeats n=1 Tax=Mucilaginibacter pineti TaxID=1391627 RepID=A0A1G6YXE0_9SPHI|nr:fasciclin domain-containing protein [Mucilaginibacter pineti]SDD94981.1 Uncaracterized surface protein containing fasciclin (FAS1) repeats [Mucilaginibacter pineti]
MKKLLLLAPILLYATTLFAQSTGTSVSSPKNIGPMTVAVGDSMRKTNDIIQNIALTKDLSVFYSFIKATNFAETYKSKGPITIFVPVNEAFAILPASKIDSLNKPAHFWELTGLIANHAIAGSLTARDIEKQINGHKGLATFITLAGSKLTAKIDANRNIVLIDETGGESILDRFDIKQSNGMLHVVNHVLVPKVRVI